MKGEEEQGRGTGKRDRALGNQVDEKGAIEITTES